MKESICNRVPGTVKVIVSGKILSERTIETAAGEISAIITTNSVKDLRLREGDRVFALIKATDVSAAK